MKFRYQDTIFPQTLSTHCLFICKPLNMWTREPLRQGETCFLNSEMPKKIHACPNVNKWIERHLRVPYYSPPLFPTIANHCSLHYYLSPQAGLREMRRKLRSTFSALNLLVAIKTFKASRMSIGWYHSIVWRHLFNRLPWLWLLFFFLAFQWNIQGICGGPMRSYSR